jgi:hypothetical protein
LGEKDAPVRIVEQFPRPIFELWKKVEPDS